MSGMILTCNAGSSNTKFGLFDAVTLACKTRAVTHSQEEFSEWLASIQHQPILAIGHRVVHGGRHYSEPTMITEAVLSQLHELTSLAPLHQPPALDLIVGLQSYFASVPHLACFDTAFHQTSLTVERRFPLPIWYHRHGIQRYGFHGLSYESIASMLPEYLGDKADANVIVAHLGNGSSACAMQQRKSLATTMGFSTLDGLMMGTRSGAIDPGVLLYLLKEMEMRLPEVERLLYLESGLQGVSGISADMRVLLASERPEAREAIELYCHLTAKHIASLIPSMGGLDALIFTGGIGEHAALVREQIIKKLSWISDLTVCVIPTNEEQMIANACSQFLARSANAA